MSIIEEVLIEEYERSCRISRALEQEIAELPKGSIQKKQINGSFYHYLMFRDADKVKTTYIPAEDVEELQKKIARRKEDIAALKEQKKSQRQLERALGKELRHDDAAT